MGKGKKVNKEVKTNVVYSKDGKNYTKEDLLALSVGDFNNLAPRTDNCKRYVDRDNADTIYGNEGKKVIKVCGWYDVCV